LNEKGTAPKSIIEDIFDEMFNIIEKKDIFSNKTIQRFKELAYTGNFKNEALIIEVLKSEDGEKE